MTNSTAHNLGVIQEVGTELWAESSPLWLVCNVYLLMVMQGKVKSAFKEIQDMHLEQVLLKNALWSILISVMTLYLKKPYVVWHPSSVMNFLQNNGINNKSSIFPLNLDSPEVLKVLKFCLFWKSPKKSPKV